jgi:hypothetical protein
MSYESVDIINGDHDPPFPFVVVGNRGLHVDLSNIRGQLWDENTV